MEDTMELKQVEKNGQRIAVITGEAPLITDVQSALDLIMTVKYETGCQRIAIDKTAITESFFQLRSGLAGEVLQKFVNYHIKAAIYGDYSQYTSKALKDFIYESNSGSQILFPKTQEEAVERLSNLSV